MSDERQSRKERDREYYLKNRERILESKREAYRLLSPVDRAILDEKKKARYMRNRPRELQYRKEWWAANRESQTVAKREKWSARTDAEKSARRVYLRRSYARNPIRQKEWSARWIAKNPEKVKLRAQRGYQNNKASHDERSLAWYREHPDVANAKNARRRAAKTNATPPWITPAMRVQIAAFYAEARRLTKETGIEHHVDHIFPLRSPVICGLHVPWNLQILTVTENSRKHNHFTPGVYECRLS